MPPEKKKKKKKKKKKNTPAAEYTQVLDQQHYWDSSSHKLI